MASMTNQPIIDIATYSDTDVYECYIRGYESRIVMRRTKDDWINITQVLKLAHFTKTQRTRVLEKESVGMEHEKVQGGYGRFQGTWIPLPLAKEIVQKYSIDDPVVTTILNFKLDPDNPPQRRTKNSILRRASPGARIQSPSSYNKTPKKKILSSASHGGRLVQSTGQKYSKRLNPTPLKNVVFQTPQHTFRQNDPGTINTDETVLYGDDSMVLMDDSMRYLDTSPFYLHNPNFKTGPNQQFVPTPNHNYSATQKPLQFFPFPVRKKQGKSGNRSASANVPNQQTVFINENMSGEGINMGVFKPVHGGMTPAQNFPVYGTPQGGKLPTIVVQSTDKNNTVLQNSQQQIDFQIYQQQQQQEGQGKLGQVPPQYVATFTDEVPTGAKDYKTFSTLPLRTRLGPYEYNDNSIDEALTSPEQAKSPLTEQQYRDTLLEILSSETVSPEIEQKIERMYNSPSNFDVDFSIDSQGHTALHWAAAMGNLPLIKLLLHLNANVQHYNSLGFNCLTKALFYNNCYKNGSFDTVVDLLNKCLVTPDKNGRLPLHYLIELSVNQSKDPVVINSYLDTVLRKLRQLDSEHFEKYINHQDNMGNTPLHLAALNLNLTLWNKLSSIGASLVIANADNETPISVLYKYNLTPPLMSKLDQMQQQSTANNQTGQPEMQASKLLTPGFVKHDTRKRSEYEARNMRTEDVYLRDPPSSSSNFAVNIDGMLEDISTLNSFLTASTAKNNIQKFSPGEVSQHSPVIFKSNMNKKDTEISTHKHSEPTRQRRTSALWTKVLFSPTPTGDESMDMPEPSAKELQFHSQLISQLQAFTQKPGEKDETGSLAVGTNDSSNQKETPLESKQSGVVSASTVAEGRFIDETADSNALLKLTEQLRSVAKRATTMISGELDSLTHAVGEVEETLAESIKKKSSMICREKKLLSEEGVVSIDGLVNNIASTKASIQDKIQVYSQHLEESQALGLARLVENEESLLHSDSDQEVGVDQELGVSGLDDVLRLSVKLSILQLRRRSLISDITKLKTELNTTEKIKKYRHLIGTAINDTDFKLDVIEEDLRANS